MSWGISRYMQPSVPSTHPSEKKHTRHYTSSTPPWSRQLACLLPLFIHKYRHRGGMLLYLSRYFTASASNDLTQFFSRDCPSLGADPLSFFSSSTWNCWARPKKKEFKVYLAFFTGNKRVRSNCCFNFRKQICDCKIVHTFPWPQVFFKYIRSCSA